VSPAQSVNPKVFVSSVYREETVPGSEKHLAIRRMIRDVSARLGVDAWIAEYRGLTGGLWTEIVDSCIDNLLDSDVVIVVLYRRGGNPMPLGELGFARASFFEIELFYASLRLIPAYFFVVSGYEPEPELENLVRLLKLKDQGNWYVGTENQVETGIRELLAAIAKGAMFRAHLPNFCDLTSEYKSFRHIDAEIHSEQLSLIDRLAPLETSDFALDRIDFLISEAEAASSKSAQFSRLWLAMRELSKRSFDTLDAAGQCQWLRISRRLPSMAAWLGLHGPLNVGVMAGYQTQNELRRRGTLANELFPYGAFGSESYSIAGNHALPAWKRVRYRAAERLATRHAELHPENPSGALLIRGSARMRLAQLGCPWLIWSGLADYRRACEIREKRGATASELGEALIDRGFAEFAVSRVFRFRRRNALRLMSEAIAYLETDISPGRVGFVVSAKRKYADALERAGRRDEAQAQQNEAAALAKRFGIIGQLSRLPAPSRNDARLGKDS
jgi:hypothetical protein